MEEYEKDLEKYYKYIKLCTCGKKYGCDYEIEVYKNQCNICSCKMLDKRGMFKFSDEETFFKIMDQWLFYDKPKR
jgi:hypothetical protein